MVKNESKRDTDRGWLLPSNHQNVLFMLGSGLITDPIGFRVAAESKYYQDVLALHPGWVLLYFNQIPEEIRRFSIEEAKGLVFTALSLSLDDYRGEVFARTDTGQWVNVPFQKTMQDVEEILVPAPIPASWVRGILFDSSQDQAKFTELSSSFANVDIGTHLLQVMGRKDEDLFSNFVRPRDITGDPPTGMRPARTDSLSGQIQLNKAQAVGGILATLYGLANRSDLCLEVFKKARDVFAEQDEVAEVGDNGDDPIVKGIPSWLAGESLPGADPSSAFFYRLLDEIITNRHSYSGSEITSFAKRFVCDQQSELQRVWHALPRLLEELDMPQLTLSEQFERFKGTVSHALLLFFQRENGEELLQFTAQNPSVHVSCESLIAAALLFGARDGWIGQTTARRKGISDWVVSVMASLCHATGEEYLALSDKVPIPLRELFSGEDWQKNEHHALWLSRKSKWDCIETRIKIPSAYRVERGWLIIPGDVKESAIQSAVDQKRFLDGIASGKVDGKLEELVRVQIRGVVS